LLFVASAGTAQGTDLRTDITDLVSLVGSEQARATAVQREVELLRKQVADASTTAGAADGPAVMAAAAAAELAPAAGMTAVSGRGLVVTLDDAPNDPGVRERANSLDDLVVHQQDIQAVVNALWQGGAQAMMLMDQRVISTSAVRCIGNTLSLHGTPYSPPYVVTAIGDPDSMRAALDASPEVSEYQDYVAAFGLGYAVATEDELQVPAYTGPSTLQFARVADATAPAT